MSKAEIFLFEYATCGAFPELSPSITVEGLGMLKTLLTGFQRAITFVDRRIPIFPEYPGVKDYRELFTDYLKKADFSLIIAPEKDFVLYDLTRELEKVGGENLGSTSKGVKIASDKFLTYKALKGVNTPRTEINKGKTSLEFPLVAKPRCGVSCEGIYLINCEDELKALPKDYLLQEFLEGRPCSASLLVGDETKILSINTQEINNFVYEGAKIPVELEDKEEILKAVERIKGLKGYIGVDFVFNDEVNVIEINPRPTTPIIALEKVFDFKLSDLILKNHLGEKISDFKPRKKIFMRKLRGRSGNSFVTFGEYSIALEAINEDINL